MGFFGAIKNVGSEISAKGLNVINSSVATNPNAAKMNAQLSEDVFEKAMYPLRTTQALKEMSVGEVAKSFKNIISGTIDWESGLPKDGEAGCGLLKRILQPYKELFETNWKYKPDNVEGFFRRVFGISHIGVLEEGRKINTSFNDFVSSAEDVVGKSFNEFFHI